MADVPASSGLLHLGQELVAGPQSPSDDPYDKNHPQPFRRGTAIPPPGTTATTGMEYAKADEARLQTGSMSSVHLPLHAVGSSMNGGRFLKDPLQESRSHISGHELPRSHSRQRGHMEDTHSIHTHTSYMRHLSPYTRHASDSRITVNTNHSIARSIAGSESRKSAYRTHEGTIHQRPVSVHGSIADDVPGTPGTVSAPLDLPGEALPASDIRIDPHVHYTAPPGSGEGPGSEVVVLYDGPPISAMVARDVRRYTRLIPRDSADSTKTTVPAMTVKFRPHDMDIPQGWVTVVHPEGARYFVNQANRTLTEMNICDGEICEDIEYYMEYLLEELKRVVHDEGLDLDMQQVDLVLEPKVFGGDSVVCCYYFVNHRDRCLFWLDDYNAWEILSDCAGVKSLSHIQLAIQAQYWRHWDYFPSLCIVTPSLVNEARDMLLHATCDHLTSMQSSAVFDLVELKDYLSVVDKIQVYPPEERSIQKCHSAIVIGRVMYSFYQNHFTNFHGEDCVRLNYEQSSHGWKYVPSLLMRILTFLLFFDPVIQIRELHKIFVDEIVAKSRWDAFTVKFKEQLQDSNLLATVLLNANVGFLAINTVDRGGRSIIQLASYMSLVTSLGSIVLGLVFVSRGRISGKNTAPEAAKYLSRLHNKKHGLETLAIIYSLPKALLMWGMAFFFTAFATSWWIPGDGESRAIVGVGILVVFVLLVFSIIRTLDQDPMSWGAKSWLNRDIHRELLSRLACARRQFMEFMGIESGQRDISHEPQSEQVDYFQMGTPRSSTQASIREGAAAFGPTDLLNFQPENPTSHDQRNHPHDQENHPDPPVLHGDTSILPSLDLHTTTGILSGLGSLQQISENAQTIFHEQPTVEAHPTPDEIRSPVNMDLTASPYPASESIVETGVQGETHSDAPITKAAGTSYLEGQAEAVATNTAASISPGLPRVEESKIVRFTEHVVEEPRELERSQSSRSSTPPPKIYAKSATADYFHHAPVAAKWTLQDGFDIAESKG